jgi:(S)-ureidoglycine aminohydrolase
MHEFGHTRSARCADHLLQTPETFVRAPLPGMTKATAVVHAAPALGARFVQYTAEFEAGGLLGPAVDQRFIYVLDGELTVDATSLIAGDYAYVPSGGDTVVSASKASRAAVFEKPYQALAGITPPLMFTGSENHVASSYLNDDPALDVRALVPDNAAFDFRVNTMTYLPGAALPAVESHVMEHGLLMLAGGGIYRLGSEWYPVATGDFIWMAAYCPQWFGALGKTPAKYLIYKDWDRHPR